MIASMWEMSRMASYKWPNSEIYEGSWVAKKRNGHGAYKWQDGDFYEGGWKDGEHHGKGIKKSREAKILEEGVCKDGVFQG